MIEKILPHLFNEKETVKRSVAKAVIYRAVILILDFTFIYLFTGKLKIALGFMIISNTYSLLGYFIYERIWERIRWGKALKKEAV